MSVFPHSTANSNFIGIYNCKSVFIGVNICCHTNLLSHIWFIKRKGMKEDLRKNLGIGENVVSDYKKF